MFLGCVFFFFCKQRTAYEMRIGDWSSDVCSSDLRACSRACLFPPPPAGGGGTVGGGAVGGGSRPTPRRLAGLPHLRQLDRAQPVDGGARGVGAGIAGRDLGQGLLGFRHQLLPVLRQADLQQRAGRLVVGRIAVDQGLELLLRQRVVLGDVVALAEPVVGIRRLRTARVDAQRPEGRRVGTGCVSTCRSRWLRATIKKK